MCGKHFKQSDFFMKVTESFKLRAYAQLLHSKLDYVLAGCHIEPTSHRHALTLV